MPCYNCLLDLNLNNYSNFIQRPPANSVNNQLNPSAKEFAPLQMSKSFDFANKVI